MSKFLITTLALATLAGTAQAHSTLEQRTATIGETTKITIRVPHGCGHEATHTVHVSLPDGVYNAKPMPKPDWTLTTTTAPYAAPYNNHGTEMTEGTREITWSDGDLHTDWYDEFTFRAKILGEAGDTLYFPIVQTCANGTADWTDTSGADGVSNPAPKLTLVAGTTQHTMPGTANIGHLALTGGFTRATLPGAPVAGGFVTITNNGTSDDVLVSATSDIAGVTQVHEMKMENDVMKMRELPDGLPLPAGETTVLKPGGYHIMFMDLQDPLVEGDTVTATLTFRDAGTVDITLPIGAPNARAADGMEMHSGHDMPSAH